MTLVSSALAVLCIILAPVFAGTARAAPTCALSYGATDAAKSHKLYPYFLCGC